MAIKKIKYIPTADLKVISPISMAIGKPGIWQWPHLVVGQFRFLFIAQTVEDIQPEGNS